jgi:ABC-type phosphate/phosphonate transport system substrate-binding protein
MNREHCKLFLDNRCVKIGTTPENFYAAVTAPADSEDALDCVVDGTAQAAVIDGVAMDAYKVNKPGRAKLLKTLLQSEAFPAAVIAYNPDVVNTVALERFRQGLLSARDQVFADIAKAYPPPPAK